MFTRKAISPIFLTLGLLFITVCISEASFEGTIGTRFTVTGSAFGIKKPKVYIEYEKRPGVVKKEYIKVETWSDTSITCLWTKSLPPGTYSLWLQPTIRGAVPSLIDTLSIMKPVINKIYPDTLAPGAKIIINGQFFTSKKPTVYLRDLISMKKKSCKVLNSTMDPQTGASSLEFIVPVRSSDKCEIILQTLIGEATTPGYVERSLSVLAETPYPASLLVRNGYLYWSDATQSPIKKISVNGGDVTSLTTLMGNPRSITLKDQYVFWIDEHTDSDSDRKIYLKRTSLDGTETVILTEVGHESFIDPYDVVVDDKYVYWVNSAGVPRKRSIEKIPIDGGTPTTVLILDPSKEVLALKGDEDYIYWEDMGNIYKVSKEGGTPVVVAEGFSYLKGNFIVDNGEIYFADDYDGGSPSFKYRIMKTSVSGGSVITLADIDSRPIENMIRKLSVDDSNVYWIDIHSVYKVPRDGGEVIKLADVMNPPALDLALNNDKVFWTEHPGPKLSMTYGTIKSIPKNGGAITVLLQEDTPYELDPWLYELATDSNSVYWTEAGRIAKIPFDGGIVTTIASGVSAYCPPITADDSYIYIADTCTVKKLPLNGIGHLERIATSFICYAYERIAYIATDGNYVFWRSYGPVEKVSVDGGPVTSIYEKETATSHNSVVAPMFTGFGDPLKVANGYVYWTGHQVPDPTKLLKSPTTGGASTTLVSGYFHRFSDLAIDDDFVYFSKANSTDISKVSINGGPSTSMVMSAMSPFRNLAIDGRYLYWYDIGGVGKVSLDNGDRTNLTEAVLETGNILANTIVIDDSSVYWLEVSAGLIMKLTPK